MNPQIGSIKLPFLQYEVKFGTKGGFDIEAENGSEKLVGEAFNVARSYFPDKIRKMRAKLKNENNFDYKIFNLQFRCGFRSRILYANVFKIYDLSSGQFPTSNY